ncbi:MAG: hypothetical protein QW666_01280, partial [Candidatus Woesearchaeota archaeon]
KHILKKDPKHAYNKAVERNDPELIRIAALKLLNKEPRVTVEAGKRIGDYELIEKGIMQVAETNLASAYKMAKGYEALRKKLLEKLIESEGLQNSKDIILKLYEK